MELTWGAVPEGLLVALAPLLERAPGAVGLAWLDLTTNRGWSLADHPRPAASLVKVPLAVAAYQAAERGELDLRERVAVPPLPEDDEAEFDDLGAAPAGRRFAWRKLIDRAITESDNAATNTLLDRLGLGALDGLKTRLKLQHTTLSRRMLDASAREAGRENLTTAVEALTVLAALWHGELLTGAHTAELLGLLGQQRHTEKLAAGLPPGTLFRHKTGELPGYRHDVGIVEGDRPYAIAALASAPPGREAEVDAWLAELAAFLHGHHLEVMARLAEGAAWLLEVAASHDPRLEATQVAWEPGDPPVLVGHSTHAGYLTPPPHLQARVEVVRTQGQPGVVVVPCLHLRGGPGHAHELVSQLRLGDRVEVLEAGEDWHRLRGPDGYVAYGRSNNLRLGGAPWQPTHFVAAPSAKVGLPEGRRLVLSAGSSLEAVGDRRFCLPTGIEVDAPSGLKPLGHRGDIEEVLAFALEFLGLPYLWGGTTCWGLDCSGLVQLAYAVAGVALPRDADQQEAALPPVTTLAELVRGDLVFFPGHVGLYLGGMRYVHASAQSAMTTVNSFDAADPLYDAKLHQIFSGGGRSPLATTAAART